MKKCNCIAWKGFMEKIVKKIKNIPKRIYRKYESGQYRKGKYSKSLKIMDAKQTLEYLNNNCVSFCRFGDGEIAIMNGESIAFQQYHSELAKRLKKILIADEVGLLVGINYFYLNPISNVNQYTQNFLNAMANQRKFMIKNCNRNMTYMDAAITQMYQNYENFDFEHYFQRFQKLFEKKDVTVVCGKNVLNSIQYNALSVCNSVEYIYAPNKDAFSQYDEIFEKVMQTNEKRIVCAILGPTAKVLVYDLFKVGRTAWDIGHYLKDYDAYMRKMPKTDDMIEKFFKPD